MGLIKNNIRENGFKYLFSLDWATGNYYSDGVKYDDELYPDQRRNIMRNIFILFLGLFLVSCVRFYSSLPKTPKTIQTNDSTATLAIHSVYKMNMAHSNDIKFVFRNILSNETITPQFRDDKGNFIYAYVRPGKYRILQIQINDMITKNLIFLDSLGTIIKTLGNIKTWPNPSNKPGFFLSGTILIGDNNLKYKNSSSKEFEVKPATNYHLGDFEITGTIEGIFNDMPNLTIHRKPAIPAEYLNSFSKVISKGSLDTSTNIFLKDSLEFSKSNSIANQ